MGILFSKREQIGLDEPAEFGDRYLTIDERKILAVNLGDPKTIEDHAYVASLKHMFVNGRKLGPSEREAFRLGFIAGFEHKFK